MNTKPNMEYKKLIIHKSKIRRRRSLMTTMFEKIEYCLKYKNDIVFRFNIEQKSIKLVNENLMPISLLNKPVTFDLVKKFCADRILMLNREYCKEILTACGVDDQSDINICIICKGLSFRDNYWISSTRSKEIWEKVNLYQNEFSLTISKVALTGNMSEATREHIIGDKFFTGELTSKGTRAKCHLRRDNKLFMIKSETRVEIMSEVITYYMAQALGIGCSQYHIARVYDKECSVCEVLTSADRELIPCRDILSYHNANTMNCDGEYYKTFMHIDPINFIKMQILDYVTLNVDRNRDNFGLLSSHGKLIGLYPLFDHDACFKGKNVNGIYFPTGLTFAQTLELLQTKYQDYYVTLYNEIENFKGIMMYENFVKNIFLKCKTEEEYGSMIKRMEKL